MQKSDFKKLSDYLWEVPRSFRKDMRVPARVYATEAMLEAMMRDESLEQLLNTATLPGIEGYALLMPDGHEGYGAAIGNVFATNPNNRGVVSPGAVGYDINCLTGDAKVLTSLGYTLEIKDFEKTWIREQVISLNYSRKQIDKAPIGTFLRRKAQHNIWRVKMKGGDELTATGDHPFLTPHGMKPLQDIQANEKIALFPFIGNPFETPPSGTLIQENNVVAVLRQFGRAQNSVSSRVILRRLKEKGLLPLTYNHRMLPIILKIIGFVFGDGSINFIGKKADGITYFVGKKEDLECIRTDIRELGYTPSPVHSRNRVTINGVPYTEWSFYVNASSLVVLLHTLGVPMGSKVDQAYRIPAWLFKAPRWQKRLFLASLFGAELRIPHRRSGRRGNFNCPVFPMAKQEFYLQSARQFLQDLRKLLKEFDVKTYKFVERRPHVNTKGEKSWSIELIFPADIDNLLNLWGRIGFEYNVERAFFANTAIQYLKIKKSQLNEKKEAIRVKIPAFLQQGFSYQEIVAQLAGNPLTPRFIIDVCTKLKKGRKRIIPRIPTSFIEFEEYMKIATSGLGISGFVWDEVVTLERIPYSGYVYDFTLLHKSHNFIANNFVVSNCGMRLLASQLQAGDITEKLDALATEIQKEVPSGLGKGRQLKFDIPQMNRVLEGGSQYVVQEGYGEKDDLENCEEQGQMRGADASLVSDKAKKRGADQAGTLGSGNHFLEVQRVEQIFDRGVAQSFGLFENQVVIMVHTGSRGLGHQNATDYISLMNQVMGKYGIKLPDRELACAPFSSLEGQQYMGALACGMNFAFANRQMIAHFVRTAWERVLGREGGKLTMVYDVAHNTAKLEEHEVEGKVKKLIVHRKGSTRAFPAGHKEVVEKYRAVGQPVFIPGSMGTASYVLVGTEEGKEAFFSTCHGAGRRMSRHEAMRTLSAKEIVRRLEHRGIVVKCWSLRGVAEEAPEAYKDIDEVVDVVQEANISRKVARLVPLAVIKGE